MTILIVEQDKRWAELYADFLRELGHRAVVVASLEAAARKLEAAAPDAIVLDVDFPERGGLAFLETTAALVPRVPVIVVSAAASEELALRCLRLGALDFLPKPVPFERVQSLLAVLETHTVHPEGVARRAPRPVVAIPMLVSYQVEWTSVDLSPFGVKVPRQAWLQPGATVGLSFALPDGRPPLHVNAVLVRTDAEGHLFSFVGLNETAFRRLVDFCRSTTSDPAAMFRLGLAYEFGKGVAQDAGQAARWYRDSAALGHGPAAQRLRVLEEKTRRPSI